jgi:CRISPR/Cas system-associated protein Cas5 (RAMP superfamily)
VEIKFSRHAQRRAALYKIPPSTVLGLLEGRLLHPGTHEIVEKVEGFRYLLKVVVAVEGDRITVITNYPLKKGRTP